MAQNAILNELKLKYFLGEHMHVSRHPCFGNYRILKFHDSTEDTFNPPVLSAFRCPCPWQAHTHTCTHTHMHTHKHRYADAHTHTHTHTHTHKHRYTDTQTQTHTHTQTQIRRHTDTNTHISHMLYLSTKRGIIVSTCSYELFLYIS